jgi:DNA processing protein
MKINKISPTTSVFTERLSLIDDAPERLYYVGTLPETPIPVVAIVGTRKPTKYGTEVTQRIAYDLAKKGVVIVSGLALGVDALAHRAALEAGGVTVGVVINELPDISPRTNVPLAKQMIARGGAVMSEWGAGDGAFFTKASFLRRNRLVSGLSDAIIITEAAAQSGTLNTAAHALAQGREVFVVPGNITSPLSEGCSSSRLVCLSKITQVAIRRITSSARFRTASVLSQRMLRVEQNTRTVSGSTTSLQWFWNSSSIRTGGFMR